MLKRQLSAKEILQDIRAGMDDTALMEKYQLSAHGLQSAYAKLAQAGLLTQAEVSIRPPNEAAPRPCPACKTRLPHDSKMCPHCGIVIAKHAAWKENVRLQNQQEYQAQRARVEAEKDLHQLNETNKPKPQYDPGLGIKVVGLALVAIGLIGLLGSIMMDTTVPLTDGKRIHNIGLLGLQVTFVILGGVLFLSGILLFVVGFTRRPVRPESALPVPRRRYRDWWIAAAFFGVVVLLYAAGRMVIGDGESTENVRLAKGVYVLNQDTLGTFTLADCDRLQKITDPYNENAVKEFVARRNLPLIRKGDRVEVLETRSGTTSVGIKWLTPGALPLIPQVAQPSPQQLLWIRSEVLQKPNRKN